MHPVEGSEIWDNGYQAYHDGRPKSDNPYDEDDPRYDTWEHGWETADADSDDN